MDYANELHRLYTKGVVQIDAVVAQDYMCEDFILQKTGLDILTHQQLTIQRYDDLVSCLNNLFGSVCPFHIMPVLQGYKPEDYTNHINMYGDRLKQNMWVGVGSVCKRNSDPQSIIQVLSGIKSLRPDLQLHGFGVKITSLQNKTIQNLLSTADSMAWSYSARKQGRNQNDWREAKAFEKRVYEFFKENK